MNTHGLFYKNCSDKSQLEIGSKRNIPFLLDVY